MTIQTMPCYRCKTEITIRPNVKYCKVCAPIVKKEQNVAKSSFKTEQRRQDREAKRKVEKERTEARIIITDEEQLQINKAIDNKHNFQLACRTISPGDPDFAEIAQARTGFTPEQIPNTSTFRPENPPQQPAVPAAAPAPNKKTGSWVLPALSGAAYGIQANVGRPIAGQEWTQGLLKGVVGTGMAAAAQSRMSADRAQGEREFAEKMALLDAKISGAPTEEDKFAGYEKRMALRQANTLEAIAARNKGAVERAQQINALEKASGWNQKDLARLKVDILGKALAAAVPKDERDAWVETHYQDLLTGLGQFKVPQR